MFNPLMMLAVEARGAIALRTMKMMRGGRTARREANLMVSEKIKAAQAALEQVGSAPEPQVARRLVELAWRAKRNDERVFIDGIPHWLIVAGGLLLMLGFFGIALRQRGVEADPSDKASDQEPSKPEADLTQEEVY